MSSAQVEERDRHQALYRYPKGVASQFVQFHISESLLNLISNRLAKLLLGHSDHPPMADTFADMNVYGMRHWVYSPHLNLRRVYEANSFGGRGSGATLL
jgi:hypothetical protein